MNQERIDKMRDLILSGQMLNLIEELQEKNTSLENDNIKLQENNEKLKQQVSQTNADLLGFMDFYFNS